MTPADQTSGGLAAAAGTVGAFAGLVGSQQIVDVLLKLSRGVDVRQDVIDKLDGVVVSVSRADAAPTVDSAKADYVAKLEAAGRAVRVSAVKQVKLPAGTAIRIVYTSNSEPNAVTNRQVRLENERYLYFKDGKLVALDLYAPKGADNVDQWQLMSNSFRWK